MLLPDLAAVPMGVCTANSSSKNTQLREGNFSGGVRNLTFKNHQYLLKNQRISIQVSELPKMLGCIHKLWAALGPSLSTGPGNGSACTTPISHPLEQNPTITSTGSATDTSAQIKLLGIFKLPT